MGNDKIECQVTLIKLEANNNFITLCALHSNHQLIEYNLEYGTGGWISGVVWQTSEATAVLGRTHCRIRRMMGDIL